MELAKIARAARQDFARGKKLAFSVDVGSRTYAQFSKHEQILHQQFHTGQLERALIAANQNVGQKAKDDDIEHEKLWELVMAKDGDKD